MYQQTESSSSEHIERLHFIQGRSMLVDCVLAQELPIDVGPRSFCHAGPPLDGLPPSRPLKAAAVAGLLIENEADTPEKAWALVEDGRVSFASNHSQGGVGALAGLVTPHVPVFVVEHSSGHRTYAPLSDGNVSSIRFGMHDTGTITNLRWCGEVLAPMLSKALAREPIDVARLLAKSLLVGDEAHNRCDGATMELLRMLATELSQVAPSQLHFTRAIASIAHNAQFGLAVGMAAAKGLADDLHRHGPPGVVTAACGNGSTFGFRVSGAGDRWFCGDARASTFTPLGPFSRDDMNPILGDSAIMEVAGLGCQALTAAPALIRRFELNKDQTMAIEKTAHMMTVSRSPLLLNPNDEFRGTPVGISPARVVENDLEIPFTMGYLSKRGDGGRVGMGIAVAPPSILAPAVEQLAGVSM